MCLYISHEVNFKKIASFPVSPPMLLKSPSLLWRKVVCLRSSPISVTRWLWMHKGPGYAWHSFLAFLNYAFLSGEQWISSVLHSTHHSGQIYHEYFFLCISSHPAAIRSILDNFKSVQRNCFYIVIFICCLCYVIWTCVYLYMRVKGLCHTYMPGSLSVFSLYGAPESFCAQPASQLPLQSRW